VAAELLMLTARAAAGKVPGLSSRRGGLPPRSPSVLAEADRLDQRDLPAQGVLEKLLAAFGTEVEAQLLINVGADLIVFGVFQAFEDVLDFLEVIAVLFGVVVGRRIQSGVDFHLDHVTEIIFRIELPLAQIA
jgi:hypothetical protein